MPTTEQAFSRDANRVPITDLGLVVSKSVTFSGNASPYNVPLFTVTGTIEVKALWGIVTVALAANHRVGSFRVNDQSAQVQITSATGATMDAAPVGSGIFVNVLAGAAATFKSSAVGAVAQPAVAGTLPFSTSIIVQKSGTTDLTNIEYYYTSSTNPSSGAMIFYCGFLPLSSDGNLTAV